jgi:hypothetical protein
MTKHTEGPWEERAGSSVRNGGAAYTSVVGPDGICVARVPIPEAISRRATAKANSRLIAAAPDLLECLQEIVENKSVALDFLTGTLARAKAAIAKAKKG